ncbi:MAG: hypothetical protein QM784_39410 [Polyangiaceae bacterium]
MTVTIAAAGVRGSTSGGSGTVNGALAGAYSKRHLYNPAATTLHRRSLAVIDSRHFAKKARGGSPELRG